MVLNNYLPNVKGGTSGSNVYSVLTEPELTGFMGFGDFALLTRPSSRAIWSCSATAVNGDSNVLYVT